MEEIWCFKPHVHILVTEGGYDSQNKFFNIGKYINYELFRKKWQYNFLIALKGIIPQSVVNYCFREYKDGFVVRINPDRLTKGRNLIKYIGRYIRHPAIANSRIFDYTGTGVSFYYESYQGIKTKTMKVFDFISAIIQHIPEKNFRLVRYYGIYSRNNNNRFSKIKEHSVIESKIKEKWVVYCPDCGEKMKFKEYLREIP